MIAALAVGLIAAASGWTAYAVRPAASSTAAPSLATVALQPPRVIIAKNRSEAYSDGNIVP
jgi:hypothetical protein